MPIIARGALRKEFAIAPEGLHGAVCCDVIDRGMVSGKYGEKHEVAVRWLLDVEDRDSDPPRPFLVSRKYNLSLHPDSNLSKDLTAWRGRPFSEPELEGFDLEKLIGAPCQIQVMHNLGSDGRKWANVGAVVPLGKGMTKMRVPESYIRVKDRPRDGHGNGSDDVPPLQDDNLEPAPF